jgi:hypothetical protein
LHLAFALAAVLVSAFPVIPALGQAITDVPTLPAPAKAPQATTIQMSLDSPADGIDVVNGRRVNIGGWAADTSGPGPGVDMVKVYIDGPMDEGGTFLGNAKYGTARNDVAGLLGNNSYTNTGFDYAWTPSGIGRGQHVLFVYAHSGNGWAYRTVSVTGPDIPNPTPTPLPAPTMAPPPQGSNNQGGYPNQGGGYQNPGGYNPYQGPLTPYGGTYLNTGLNNFGYMNQGANIPGYETSPWGAACVPTSPYSQASSYMQPQPCTSPKWLNGAPFTGF